MSGLEILGIAASILQIADLGATVSVKLCTFYRQLKAADQAAQSLSSEVALTCSILRQLGENLKQDETTRLYSAQAFETAQEVLRECEKVFRRISGAIDESRGDVTKNAIQRAARRLGFVLMEKELDVLRGNLERLKSTMLLLLNVIMYAGQVRSRAESSVLQEQRDLIRVLVEEKKASERRLDQLRRSDELVKALDSLDVDANHSKGLAVQDTLPPYQSLAQEDVLRELRTYHQLVKRLLQEVDACKSGIERSRYSRIRNGVVRVHAAEVEKFQQAHGTIVTRVFEDPLFSLASESSRSQHLKENGASRNETSSRGSGSSQEDLKKTNKEPDDRPKGILKPPREKFPEDPNPVREGVAPLKDAHKKGIPPGARWTEIDRQEDTTMVDTDSEDETLFRGRRRPRASASIALDVSPRHQRELMRQDLELGKQQMEIERLKRERARRRERENEGIIDDTELEDETILQRRRRRRASTSASREASPHQRDYDLLADQQILEKNDAREDLELMKQQMEVERLKRERARRRERKNKGFIVDTESEDETILRRRCQRHASTSVSREASPGHRDYDLLVEQRILEMNDALQDLKLRKQQMEIERLEQKLAVNAIPVPATEAEQVKEAVDAVDDLLLKWTTLGQDDLLA
ncbi:hypothetical protein CDV55_105621 [Aspergillus turcosus]|nr:hypothetical protein CDV55_105621 [Aspergillus turcosus]